MSGELPSDVEIRVTVTALKDGSTKCRFEIDKDMPFKEAEISFQRCIQALRWEAENSDKCPFAPVLDAKTIQRKRLKLIRRTGYLHPGEMPLTPAEEIELKRLDELMETLPTERNPEDQAALDIVRRAAKLIREREPSA